MEVQEAVDAEARMEEAAVAVTGMSYQHALPMALRIAAMIALLMITSDLASARPKVVGKAQRFPTPLMHDKF